MRLHRFALLFAFMCPLPVLAQGQTALAAHNEEFRTAWDGMLPILDARLKQEAQQLVGLTEKSGRFEVEIRRLRYARIRWSNAPGFTRLDSTHADLRFPRTGSWRLDVKFQVRTKFKAGFIRIRDTFDLKLTVKDLSMALGLEVEHSDPARPTLTRISGPDVDLEVDISTRGWLRGRLFSLLGRYGDRLAQKALDDALRQLQPQLAGFTGFPGAVPGAGAPPLTDSGVATPFEQIVENVDLKLRAHHMPNGILTRVLTDTPQNDQSWETAYSPGGPGLSGNPLRAVHSGDCAIWTGHYLASQALRYSATGDSAALDNARTALGGVGKLLDVNGGTGLLARIAAPTNSPEAQDIIVRGVYGRTRINGVEWIGTQGSKGITRDQYSGVLFGLALTHRHVPQLRAEAAARTQQIIDYLVAVDWVITEARPFSPTTWLMINYQKLAFLLIGEQVAPGRYRAELQRWGVVAETAWLGLWIATASPEKYYKFNLNHLALYNYFKLESDPGRYQDVLRGNAIIRRYTGHHHNPHLNLIQTSIDSSLSPVTHPSVREATRGFLKRNHRQVSPPIVDLSQIQFAPVPLVGPTGQSHTVSLPTEPLPIELREYTSWFQWQRGPFTPAVANTGRDREERAGIDLVLPYWMGRHQGAF